MKWHGIYIDFNAGPQITAPPNSGKISFKCIDRNGKVPSDCGVIENDPKEWTSVHSNYRYYIPWHIEIEHEDGSMFEHNLDLKGQTVLINMYHAAIGDTVAWMPAVKAFHDKWNGRTIVCMKEQYIGLYKTVYPELEFVDLGQGNQIKANETYARYIIGVVGYENSSMLELMDFRKNNLIKHADMILDVDSHNRPPKIHKAKTVNPYKPYVCIATRASRPCKEWQYVNGWEEVTIALMNMGYDVYCVDADNKNMPKHAYDCTGKFPLDERAKLISGAKLFIGLPSGLSWIAWAVGTPVVLISGFTDSYVEFETPYRVSPAAGKCHGCWKDCDQRQSKRFDECFHFYKGYDYATKQPIPYPNGEKPPVEKWECTKSITPNMVLEQVKKALTQSI